MKTEEEIERLCNEWKQLKYMLLECGDSVSLIVSGHADFYIKTLEWVLE